MSVDFFMHEFSGTVQHIRTLGQSAVLSVNVGLWKPNVLYCLFHRDPYWGRGRGRRGLNAHNKK